MSAWVLLGFIFLFGVAFSDFTQRRVPNFLLLLAFVMQVPWLFFCGQSGHLECSFYYFEWCSSIAGFFLGFVFIPLWVKNLMGAGDIKFISTLGFVFGWKLAAFIVLCAGLPAGLHSLFCFFNARKIKSKLQRDCRGVPYAGYIALTAIIWLIWKLLE